MWRKTAVTHIPRPNGGPYLGNMTEGSSTRIKSGCQWMQVEILRDNPMSLGRPGLSAVSMKH